MTQDATTSFDIVILGAGSGGYACALRAAQLGKSVALISDAGTPGISDPGARIVARVRKAGLRIVPLPGPCAAITALSAAGFTNPHFLFYGFLPPH